MLASPKVPWIVTGCALAFAAGVWLRSSPSPVNPHDVGGSVAQSASPAILSAEQQGALTGSALKQALREVVRGELKIQSERLEEGLDEVAARGQSPTTSCSEAKRSEQVALKMEREKIMQDTLSFVEELIDVGSANQEDIFALRASLAQLGPEEGEQVLSAWITALNKGWVKVD